jgi:hypothetical protein
MQHLGARITALEPGHCCRFRSLCTAGLPPGSFSWCFGRVAAPLHYYLDVDFAFGRVPQPLVSKRVPGWNCVQFSHSLRRSPYSNIPTAPIIAIATLESTIRIICSAAGEA